MNWLRNFMQGRYGPDQLGIASIAVYFILMIVSRFIFWLTGSYVVYYIIRGVGIAIFVLTIFRLFSKNVNSRYKENQAFMRIWSRIKTGFFGCRQTLHNHRVYKYCKCPSCRIKIRVPRGKGKIEITCPKCGRAFIKKS